MLALTSAGAFAAERPRPSLLVTRQDVARAKELIATRPWAADLYQDVRAAAEQKNTVVQALVYQIDGDRQAADRAKAALLAAGSAFRPGGPYHWGIGVNEAITYDLVAETCTDAERQQIEGYLRRLCRDAIQWKDGTGGTPNMSFVCHWSVGVTGYALGERGDEEIVRWALHDEHEGRPIIGGLFPTMEVALRDKRLWHEAPIYGNFTFYGMLLMATAAKNAAGRDLYHEPADNGVTICGIMEGMFSMAYPIERTGVPDGSIRQITWGHGSTTNPNRRSNEDVDPFYVNKPTGQRHLQNLYHLFTIAHHLEPDPPYAWLLGLNPRHDEPPGWFVWFPWALFYTDPQAKPPAGPPPMPSVVYPEMGLAILRADESPGYWTSGKPVLVHLTGEPYGHIKYDHMQIMLFANGRLMYPSWLCQQYEPVGCAPQRHNKVVVDKRPNSNEGKSRQRYEFSPEVKFLTNTCTGLNAGVAEVRSLFVTDEYVADFYDLKSDRQHTYDWFLHGIGNLELVEAPLYKPARDFAVDYPWIEHERRWTTDSAVRADFLQRDGGVIRGIGRWSDVWFDGFAGVRLTLLGEPGTSVYGGDDPFSAPEIDWGRQRSEPQTSIAAFCARRLAENTTFVALHEPYAKSPRLSVRRLGRSAGAEAMLITGPDFVDVVCTALGDAETLHTVGDPLQGVNFRNYAWIRIAGGKVHARGGIDGFCLRVPGAGEEAVLLNGKRAACARRGAYVVYPKGPSVEAGLVAIAASDEAPRRVGPGETFPLEVRLVNDDPIERAITVGFAAAQDQRLLSWKAEADRTALSLKPGESALVKFAVTVPTDAKVGATHEIGPKVEDREDNKRTFWPLGRVAIVPPFVLAFNAESVRMATGAKRSVGLTINNPTGSTVRGRVRLAGLAQAKVEPAEIDLPPIPPGGKHTCNLTLLGGDRNELGQVWAQVIAADLVRGGEAVSLPAETVEDATASLPVSVGVTVSEDLRHKLPFPQSADERAYHPVWIVRAPAYEIWFSQRHGLGRTLLDSSNHSVYAWAWGGISGLCEFWREVNGPGDYRCIHGGDPDCRPKQMTWSDTTLECESPFGDRVTIECTEQHVRWRVTAPVAELFGRGYGMRLHGLFGHPSCSVIHSDDPGRPEGWPDKVGDMVYCCIRQPGFSPDCIWIAATDVVPRCTMTDRGISVEWRGLKKSAFDMVVGIAPEPEVLQRMQEAAGTR
jgi:hypothetical protein